MSSLSMPQVHIIVIHVKSLHMGSSLFKRQYRQMFNNLKMQHSLKGYRVTIDWQNMFYQKELSLRIYYPPTIFDNPELLLR